MRTFILISLFVGLPLVSCDGQGLPMDETIPVAETANLSEPKPYLDKEMGFTLFEGPSSLPGTLFQYVKIRRQDGMLYGAWVEPGFSKKVGEGVTLWQTTVYHTQDVPQLRYASFFFAR